MKLPIRARKLLNSSTDELTVRSEWAFDILIALIGDVDLTTSYSTEETEQRLVEQAVRLADLLASKLTEK